MGDKRSRTRNANYAFYSQKEPQKPMCQGEFANMPGDVINIPYGQAESYRDGLVNAYAVNIQDRSRLNENRRFNEDNEREEREVVKSRYPGDRGDFRPAPASQKVPD